MTQHRQIEIYYRKKIEKEHEQNFTSNVTKHMKIKIRYDSPLIMIIIITLYNYII